PDPALDLKVLVDFGDGAASGGSYVRIAARGRSDRPGQPGTLLRAVFTSLAEPDRAPIDRLLEAAAARAGAGPRAGWGGGGAPATCSRMAASDGRPRRGAPGCRRAVPQFVVSGGHR